MFGRVRLIEEPRKDKTKGRKEHGVYQRGKTGHGVMPNNPYTGSSRGVSGCTSNPFSQRVAVDIGRSRPGSESDLLEDGEASSARTIAEL